MNKIRKQTGGVRLQKNTQSGQEGREKMHFLQKWKGRKREVRLGKGAGRGGSSFQEIAGTGSLTRYTNKDLFGSRKVVTREKGRAAKAGGRGNLKKYIRSKGVIQGKRTMKKREKGVLERDR